MLARQITRIAVADAPRRGRHRSASSPTSHPADSRERQFRVSSVNWTHMDVGIHRSVRRVFPPDHLHELISDLGSVAVVPDDRPVEDCDALVTFDYGPRFSTPTSTGSIRFRPASTGSRSRICRDTASDCRTAPASTATPSASGRSDGVASRADCLGMHVTGVRRTPTPVDHVERVYMPADLTDAVAEARFVVLTARSPTTRGD